MAKGVTVTKLGATGTKNTPAALDVVRDLAARTTANRLSLLEARVTLLQGVLQRYMTDPSSGAARLKELAALTSLMEADGGGGDVPKAPTRPALRPRAKKPAG